MQIGFALTPEVTRRCLADLDDALAAAGRSRTGCEVVVTPANADPRTLDEFAALGVDRLVLQPGSQREAAVARRVEELAAYVRQVA